MAFTPFAPETFPPSGNPSDIDTLGVQPEAALSLPWVVTPANPWLDYRIWVECLLDAGMSLHKPLPQNNPSVDTLASVYTTDAAMASSKAGTNLNSSSAAVDIIQRMASSTYRFVLRGYGLRVGYPVPVPGLKSVGGVPCVPAERQWVKGNMIVSNLMGGIPVFFNAWELHYFVAVSPKNAKEPVLSNPALHIRSDAQLPTSILLPRAPLDQRALEKAPAAAPNVSQTFVKGGP